MQKALSVSQQQQREVVHLRGVSVKSVSAIWEAGRKHGGRSRPSGLETLPQGVGGAGPQAWQEGALAILVGSKWDFPGEGELDAHLLFKYVKAVGFRVWGFF